MVNISCILEILKIYIVFFQTLENTNLFSKEHRIHIYFGRENIQREIETICIKKPTKMESRTISQILMISVQKDSPRLQVGPPNQPGRTLCLPLLPHPIILPCSPLLPSIPQSAHSSRQMLLSESEIQIILLILRRGASYCKYINCI